MYYKFTNKECCHNNFQYVEGVNTDIRTWNTKECAPGGLYIVPQEHFARWLTYRDDLYWVWDAEPVGDLINVEPKHKVKCNSVRLSNRHPIGELQEIRDNALALVKKDGRALRYVRDQIPEICLAAVQQNGHALEYVRNQTPEICMAAVKQNGYVLRYVRDQTPEICLAAIHQDWHALEYVDNQTPEIYLAAVRQDGYALEYVRDQTPEICLAAVQQDGYALLWVRDQTPGICLASRMKTQTAVL